MSQKVLVNLSEEDMEKLRAFAKKHGITMTDVIRRALATEQFLDEAKDEGSQILIRDKEKNFRELVLR